MSITRHDIGQLLIAIMVSIYEFRGRGRGSRDSTFYFVSQKTSKICIRIKEHLFVYLAAKSASIHICFIT